MVVRSPSSNAVWADQPNSSGAARHVESPARLAVRLGHVPPERGSSAGELCDQLGEVPDRDLFCRQVEGLAVGHRSSSTRIPLLPYKATPCRKSLCSLDGTSGFVPNISDDEA
jgi:hypothetical protein